MSWRKKILFMSLPLIVLLGLGELIARFAMTSTTPDGLSMEPHPTRGWQLSEHAVDALGHPVEGDANGMRYVERTGAERLILTTGDSSIYGHGLLNPDTLHGKLQAELSRQGFSVDVLTAAAPGYTSKQSLVQLEEVGWSLSPSLLIVGNLWSDNDIVSNEQNRSDGGFEDESWLMRNSALWRLAALYLKVDGDPFEAVGWMEDRHMEAGWRRVPPSQYARTLDQIFLAAAKRRVGVLVLTPCNSPLASGERLQSGFPWDVYFETLRSVAKRRRIPIVEGCEALSSAGLAEEDAFLDLMHPTADLNEAYAKALSQALISAGWPHRDLLPDVGPPLFKDAITDNWPSLIPNPNRIDDDMPDVKGPPPAHHPQMSP